MSQFKFAILHEVYPNKGESKEDFISRFMSVTKDEYPDIKQRYAVALSYWDNKDKKEEQYLVEDIEAMKKYYPNIPEEDFMDYVELDPTYKGGSNNAGIYGKWILTLANKGEIENIGHLTDVLKRFDTEKNHLINKDIMKYKSIQEVENMLNDDNSYKDLTHRQGVRQRQNDRRNVDLNKEAKLVYEDADWEVWIPNTYAASCRLGQGTSWCTASTESDSYYNDYTDEGQLFININKHNPKEKYQFHFESDSFMDANDDGIDIVEFMVANPALYKFYSDLGVQADTLIPSYDEYINLKENDFTVVYYEDSDFEEIKHLIKKVIVDDTVRNIPSFAFEDYSALEQVVMGGSVETIGDAVFADCSNLTNITIGNNVTSIGNYAFERCTSLPSITIPDSVISIGKYAFYNCTNLTSATIGNGVTSIESNAFNACISLPSIDIPDGVTTIGMQAFQNCESLTSITIPDSVTYIGKQAFDFCPNIVVVTDSEYVERFCEENDIPFKPLTESITRQEAYKELNKI